MQTAEVGGNSRFTALPLGDGDPLQYDVELPFRTAYYPMGCGIEVVTNSREVLAASDAIWSEYPQVFSGKGAKLHVIVTGVSRTPLRQVIMRGQRHLISATLSPGNFAVGDLSQGFASAWLTHDVVADHKYFRYSFLEPIAYLMIGALHLTPLHAACVALDGKAIVLCGDSGAGKTSLAYACAKKSWAYLSDDATHIRRDRTDCSVAGRPYHIRFRESARRMFPELGSFTPEQRPNGKLDLEIETRRLAIATALEAQVQHIVFLDRHAGTDGATLAPHSRELARTSFEHVLCFGDEHIREQQRRALQHFLTLPVSVLRYGDMDGAEAALRSLVSKP